MRGEHGFAPAALAARWPGTRRERFDAKWEPEPNTGCWLWTAYINDEGYGTFGCKDGGTILAHRRAWEFYRGPLERTTYLDHICRNRSCVNPDHLRPVPPKINALENSLGPTAANARKTHCKRGHPLTPDNLQGGGVSRSGRRCLVCKRISSRRERRQKGAIRIIKPFRRFPFEQDGTDRRGDVSDAREGTPFVALSHDEEKR